ncbi:MAG: bifunctional 5,10-methylenetetrahydrofolate dehydrogenase/5,10-methenyltetrahydrofolate cyclohydrolase [Chloroflexi bacterium]|nr:bifunctional 5,10-methylenetetrahydrofolate dehydrogenase/5,10-methenyltetrahydrofolate cyclohydrolase [Chloroflexota bacterium]
MAAVIIDGQEIANAILKGLAGEVANLKSRYGLVPGLVSVQVGEDLSSQSYARSEARAATEVGIKYSTKSLAEEASPEKLLKTIRDINANPQVHGIIVQLPLPYWLDRDKVLAAVTPQKDVDGLHPLNRGLLATKDGEPLFIPSTAQAVMFLLAKSGVQVDGARAVVVGRSNTVGLPVSHLLMRGNATVTICHSRTRDLGGVTRQADILVVAAGQPGLIRGDMVKPGAVVIDVGINQVPDRQSKIGYRLLGDVNFAEVKEVAGFLTPVPGGVGPVTVAMLLENTLLAAIRQGSAAGILPSDYQLRAN